jgi:hypothetical protein
MDTEIRISTHPGTQPQEQGARIRFVYVFNVDLAASSRGGDHEYNVESHIVPAHDKEAAARFFAQIFGLRHSGLTG